VLAFAVHRHLPEHASVERHRHTWCQVILYLSGRDRQRFASAKDTPRAVWNPDIEQPVRFFEGWRKMPEDPSQDNAFKAQGELSSPPRRGPGSRWAR
jgi:hypothetical protein